MHGSKALLLLLLAAAPVRSQTPAPGTDPSRAWSFIAGAGVFAVPAHPGSDETRLLPVPLVRADYKDCLFVGTLSEAAGPGLTYRPVRTSHWRWTLELGYEPARKERRADGLAGMGDRSATVWMGTGASYRLRGFSATLSGARGLKENAGWKGRVSLGHERFFGERWLSKIQTSALFSDARHAAYEFGVSPEQAQRRTSLLAAGDARLEPGDEQGFAPKGGLVELQVSATLTCLVDRHWSGMGTLVLQGLQGDARRSPLTRRPSSVAGGVGLLYRF